ncbi:MAG: hypothetical protein B6I20_09795 [Bacteroidetes bacterium 4572_117]|nr:MAG: hypothetical protein B6I20_09795 [Bacteroidetes bacterium 4572_117]
MRLLITFLISLLISSFSSAQENKVIKTKGKALVQWYPDVESKNATKERALQLAKINALENAYGVLVIQGNTVYVENKKTGEKVETNSTFKMIGSTAVKGEIIQVVKTDYKEIKKKEKIRGSKKKTIIFIECKLELHTKELKNTKIAVETYTLNSTKIIKPITDFYQGDDLFLYFRSPVNGFVTVYLDDNENAQCLLPYTRMPKGFEEAMPVIADKEYLFFSDKPEFNYFEEDDFFAEDTYELYSSSEKDINRLFVVFSKKPLNKPILNDDGNTKVLLELDKENYTLPRVIKSQVFHEWLLKIQQIRDDLVIKNIMISIEKER